MHLAWRSAPRARDASGVLFVFGEGHMLRFIRPVSAVILALMVTWSASAPAVVPSIISYQGAVTVGGTNFNGSGTFKFALVDGTGSTTLWSNNGTSVNGSEPTIGVTLSVVDSIYSVLLGDTTVVNMSAIPASAFNG